MNAPARATQPLDQHSDAVEGPVGPVAVGPTDHEPGDDQRPATAAQGPVEVRRNGVLSVSVGVLASAVAIAWLGRAVAVGGVLAWAMVGVMAVVAASYLRHALDARTPLLVADAQGVRIRLGRSWRGLPWSAVAAVEHQPRRGLLRDGRLAITPRDPDRFVDELDGAGRRQARLADRLYGAPVGVPIGLATRLVGAGEDVVAGLEGLADASVRVVALPARPRDAVVVEGETQQESGRESGSGAAPQPEDVATDAPAHAEEEDDLVWGLVGDADERAARGRDPRPWLAERISGLARRLPAREEDADAEAVVDEAEEVGDPDAGEREALPEREAMVDVAESVRAVDATDGADRVRPIARPGQPVEPLVIDDFEVRPAADPVVGPDLAAARTRLGLTVDQLAERTRIRPHVIESVEVDDFAPCGGDFYARGHLRTLARVLGIDAAPLLARYDERYAHAPIDARRVFEADLAGHRGGGNRAVRGGPNWSVLVAAFMAVVLCWSVAQLVLDSPPEVRPPSPTLRDGSAGVGNGAALDVEPVPVLVSAVQGGATVEVRDASGETVFSGDIAFGESRSLDVRPPVRVQSDDGGAVEVTVDGDWRGRMGQLGRPATQTFVAGD